VDKRVRPAIITTKTAITTAVSNCSVESSTEHPLKPIVRNHHTSAGKETITTRAV
jgi:hypothetical protein